MRIVDLWNRLEPLVQKKIDDVLGAVAYGDKIFSGIPASTRATNTFEVEQEFDADVILNGTASLKFYINSTASLRLNVTSLLSSNVHLTLPTSDGNSGEALITDGNGVLSWSSFAASNHTHKYNLELVIGDGVNVITTGSKGYLRVPRACTINAWYLFANASGSIVIDVKRCTYANFPTTSSIAGSEKPTLSSAQKNSDTSLTTWTTSLAEGDILEFVVESASTVKQVTLALEVVG